METRLRNLKKKEKGLGGSVFLQTNLCINDRLKIYVGVASCVPKFWASAKYDVASNKDNMYHYSHCPTGSDNWCKYNTGRANDSQTYQPRPGLPKEINYRIKLTFLELSNDIESEKCLHGKTQSANESFNDRIWECISNSTFATLPNLEFWNNWNESFTNNL